MLQIIYLIAVLLLTLLSGSTNYVSCNTIQKFDSIQHIDQNEAIIIDSINKTKQTHNELYNPERNAFLEWLAGFVSLPFSTTEKPILLEPPTNCDECNCGVTNKKNRIVGGQETQVNQYPWMAMLLYSNRFYCGGTLINDRYVLTAAHCVHGFDHTRISVRLMEHDRTVLNNNETITKKVMRIVKHNNYSPINYNNDIALIRLDSPVKIMDPLRPACLPTPGKSFAGMEGVVTGWGATTEQGQVSTNLQEVVVPILTNAACRTSGYGSTRITDNMLCAGYEEGKKDSCQGDSGGPLHIVNDTTHHIVGVVSWGEGCAKPKYPGVYTRVNRYGTWIRVNTQDACYC